MAIGQLAAALRGAITALMAAVDALEGRAPPVVAASEQNVSSTSLPAATPPHACDRDAEDVRGVGGLPDSVESFECWGKTILEFGKHKGSTYVEVANQWPSYLDWIRSHCQDTTVPETKDFVEWIRSYDKKTNMAKYPKSNKPRRTK
jgi:hypothetical protein